MQHRVLPQIYSIWSVTSQLSTPADAFFMSREYIEGNWDPSGEWIVLFLAVERCRQKSELWNRSGPSAISACFSSSIIDACCDKPGSRSFPRHHPDHCLNSSQSPSDQQLAFNRNTSSSAFDDVGNHVDFLVLVVRIKFAHQLTIASVYINFDLGYNWKCIGKLALILVDLQIPACLLEPHTPWE